MTLTVDTPRYFTSDRTPSTALDLNAIEAICRCGTYLFYDVDAGRLSHTMACEDCHNPRTGESDAEGCDRPHLCGQVSPELCLHGCGQNAAPHETEGICIDDKLRCCGCCQPPDYDPNDYDLDI